MSIAIMQSYFFPYIGYFQLIHSVDRFCMYEHVSFRKKSWMTRNYIYDKGTKKPKYIRIPVRQKSSYSAISNICIDHNDNWQKVILDLVYFNYKKAPFFDPIYSLIQGVLDYKPQRLHEFNTYSIAQICKYLGITTKLICENNLETENLINTKSLIQSLDNKTNRVLSLCNQYQANHYINPSGGVELYSKEDFERHGVKLNFLESKEITFLREGAESNLKLSIIDTMMYLAPKDIHPLLDKYQLN